MHVWKCHNKIRYFIHLNIKHSWIFMLLLYYIKKKERKRSWVVTMVNVEYQLINIGNHKLPKEWKGSSTVLWWTVCSWASGCDIQGASRKRMPVKATGVAWDNLHLLCSLALCDPRPSPSFCLFKAALVFYSRPQRPLRKRMTSPSACPGHPTPANRSRSSSFFPSCSLSGLPYLMSANLWVKLLKPLSKKKKKVWYGMVATVVHFQLCACLFSYMPGCLELHSQWLCSD